jgi:hypothetical protein
MDEEHSEPESLPNPALPPSGWPADMTEEAFQGPAGDLVRLIEPHTEADPHGLLLDTLLSFGNACGKGAHFNVEADRHSLNLFVAQVGISAKGRKGTALGHTDAIREGMDPEWAKQRVQSGLSSGEGLIKAVELIQSNGGADKRLLVIEDEFASVLRVMSRRGNTLGTTIRRAWDGRPLQVMVKGQPQMVAGAHISMLVQTNQEDLRRYLNKIDVLNGFANRFQWCCVRRRRLLPFGGRIPENEFCELMKPVNSALRFARDAGEISMSKRAMELWIDEYPGLIADTPGLVGSVVSRAEAQVRRLAAIYAVLEKSDVVKLHHLRAALAVWRYCFTSAQFLFSDRAVPSVELRLSRKIHELLLDHPEGMTRTEISAALSNHYGKESIDDVLEKLRDQGSVKSTMKRTKGRPAQCWFAVEREDEDPQ